MTVNTRRKNSRQRGSWTHGWGAKKKHRGAGSRGGKGNAGSGKRADTKKPSIWKNKKYFGKFGFKKKNQINITSLNIRFLEEKIDNLIKNNLAKKEGEFYVIDLKDLGCQKLLAYGKATKKFKITTKFSSANAVKKIQSVGGDVNIIKSKTHVAQEPKKEDQKTAEGAV